MKRQCFIVALTALVASGCAHQRTAELFGDGAIDRPEICVTVFFADGMGGPTMQAMLDRGQLPHIAEHFVAGGVGVEHSMASLPPITYANAVSIITGVFPGHHDVTGNRWFDPRSCTLRDYGSATTYRKVNDDFHQPTIYELLDDAFTVNVQGHTRRGVSVSIDNVVTAGLDWLVGRYSAVDARVGRGVGEVAARARRAGRWPALYFNYFPGLDEVGHRSGADSAEYAAALVTVDQAIGKIIKRVEDLAPADRRYYVLLSDHGHVPTPPGKAIDLARWLGETARLRVYEQARLPAGAGGPSCLPDHDVVLINGAFRRAAIHLLPPARTATDQPIATWPWVRGLPQLPGVAVVCTRYGADAVRATSADGGLHIERRLEDGVKQYRATPLNGPALLDAVLGDGAEARTVRDGWHNSRVWLAASANARFPDFVPQIVELFDSPRAGDVIVFAADDYSFSDDWHGGHGSCVYRDMHVPLFFTGPGLPPGGRIPAARLVDVTPTVLDLLGATESLPADVTFDGVSLLPALRSAVRPAERPASPEPAADRAS